MSSGESGLISYGVTPMPTQTRLNLVWIILWTLTSHMNLLVNQRKAIRAVEKRRFIGLLIEGAPFEGGNEHRWDNIKCAYAGLASVVPIHRGSGQTLVLG